MVLSILLKSLKLITKQYSYRIDTPSSCEYNRASMNKDYLPQKVDPFRFADNGISLNGSLLIKDMPRLCSSLFSDEGEVSVDMTFEIDEQNIKYIKGHLATHLTLQCQRCLEPFKYEIISDFLLGIVHTEEEAERLPERFDPLVVVDGALMLSDMIEEELIVSLPIVPMHDPKHCQAHLPFESDSKASAEVEKENPFKVIELLRSKRDK